MVVLMTQSTLLTIPEILKVQTSVMQIMVIVTVVPVVLVLIKLQPRICFRNAPVRWGLVPLLLVVALSILVDIYLVSRHVLRVHIVLAQVIVVQIMP